MKRNVDIINFVEEIVGCISGAGKDTTLYKYLEWLNQLCQKSFPLFRERYLPIIVAEKKKEGKKPFLSVIVRTQGKRPETLRETLLCLEGQSNGDFEIILIGHKLNEEHRKVLNQIIEEQNRTFREKIRYFELDYGTRTTPLNMGFSHARGEYVAVFDDDDLVFDNWVDEFFKASKKKTGTILHAYAFTQKWMMIDTDEGVKAPRATGAPNGELYCTDFDIIRQIWQNCCPLHTLAFPAYMFQEMGIIFDETLTTTEDWDFFMRTAFVAGVTDIKKPTCIYRLWENTETSSVLHDKTEWDKNYYKIQEKFAKSPVLLMGDEIQRAVAEVKKAAFPEQWIYRTPRITSPMLYINRGEGFNPEDVIISHNMTARPLFDIVFDLGDDEEPITEIRFDICEEGTFIARDIMAIVRYKDGQSEVMSMWEGRYNGYPVDNQIVFMTSDPMIIWKCDVKRKISGVRLVGQIHCDFSEQLMKKITAQIEVPDQRKLTLYYRTDKDFSEECSLKVFDDSETLNVIFDLKGRKGINRLRFDPGDAGGIFLNNFKVIILYGNNKKRIIGIKDCDNNGVRVLDGIAFLKSDPQILWDVDTKEEVLEVSVQGKISAVDDHVLKMLLKSKYL